MTFHPGETVRCPARISRASGSEVCRRPIEMLNLPSRTRANVRVMAIVRCKPGEIWVTCKRRSCRAQLAIRFEGVA